MFVATHAQLMGTLSSEQKGLESSPQHSHLTKLWVHGAPWWLKLRPMQPAHLESQLYVVSNAELIAMQNDKRFSLQILCIFVVYLFFVYFFKQYELHCGYRLHIVLKLLLFQTSVCLLFL